MPCPACPMLLTTPVAPTISEPFVVPSSSMPVIGLVEVVAFKLLGVIPTVP